MSKTFHVHLVSDATGETLNAVVKAALAQFEGMNVEEHSYMLVRSSRQLDRVLENLAAWPGLVFFTLVSQELRHELTAFCSKSNLPCLDVMAGPIGLMRQYLGQAESHRPGAQHDLDQRYLARIEALNFTIQHDDGQALDTINGAEVVLVGASRTSKTPTCIYLAIRGVRAANVPLVPGIPLPPQLLAAKDPLVVGLWASPDRLVQVRRNRLTTMGEARDTDYVDLDAVRGEVSNTRRLFESQDWPAIDVSRRSVEETAASVINLLAERREKR
ncbi:MAG TPA: pyruvate, water dikinase regulatory protein [Rhizomicrobium sp.]|nr:pyruvate, water dikinase regulatory protein [Rhizomicrobium sp.]